MNRILTGCGMIAVAAVLCFGMPGQAFAAPFDCPWTAASGNNPSADGCTGGGDDGCGGTP